MLTQRYDYTGHYLGGNVTLFTLAAGDSFLCILSVTKTINSLPKVMVLQDIVK